MSAKAIREATGKDLLNKHLKSSVAAKCQFAIVNENTKFADLLNENPWLETKVSRKFPPDVLVVCQFTSFFFHRN